MRIAPTGSRPAIRSPSSTAGTFASIMPKRGAEDDGVESAKRAARPIVAICVLSPISARKKATSVVRKAPARRSRVGLVDAVGKQRPYRDGEKRQTEYPAQPGSADQVPEQRAGQAGGSVIGERRQQDAAI